MRRLATICLLVGLLFCSRCVGAATASRLGQHVDHFTLRSHRGRQWSLRDFSDQKLVVIVYLGTECPLAKLYGPRLADLHREFSDRGVAFLGINANTQDGVTELTAYADRYQIPFPLLKDVGNRVADAMGATRTPEVFVLDADRKVCYHGRVDDQYGVGFARNKVQRRDLAIALEELLDGKPVSLPETEPIGCFIGRISQVEPRGDVTYSNQIARIFNRRCVECHREEEIAPFTLTSYEDILGWEDTILEVIADNRMPPWFANPDFGHFGNDARLTQEERDLIRTWVENGMPEGDPADLPPAPEFSRGWRIPEPDQVFYMRDEPFEVPAEGVVDYQHFLVDPGWDEDKYICAAEARPDNRSVVHHILVYILPPGERRADLRTILVGYAPGSTPIDLSDGVAIRVPAGSRLLFQMHYTPNGYAQSDRSYAGVKFIDKKDVKEELRGRLAINTDFRIPANAEDHVVTADYRATRDELLVSMTPHMHLRGKSFRYEAFYPDGQKEILLDVPRYDFNWQLKYILATPKLLPKGTRILCTADYDNSVDNLVNPDPNRDVRWGDQSWEEMMIGFFNVIPVQDKRQASAATQRPSIDPSGVWQWERQQGSRTLQESLTLRLEGDEIRGVLKTNSRELEINDVAMDGDRLTFQVETAGFNLAFAATVTPEKLEGDVTFTVEALGQSRKFPWVAHRERD